MDPNIIFWLCLLLHIRARNCESNESGIADGEQISDFMAQLSDDGLDASEESVSALKKVVKRVARENDKQSGFQVFFGNEDLLKEWLMGAAVTGQPGVDFPMLTNIPATSFSCRGIKGGYYADLETNCQVFHICDNGRKISFLCPNGTIFQQSQLICDWWFKVDCNKSTELYEQSAEQLAEDERKRADAKRINSEFRRPSNDDIGQKYYRTSKTNYDGKQNGRTNPYGNPAKNQLSEIEQRPEPNKHTSTRPFDPNQIFSQQNVRNNNQYSQINDLAPDSGVSSNENLDDDTSTYNDNDNTKDNQNSRAPANYQSLETQRNQLINNGNFAPKQQSNYDQRSSNKYLTQSSRYQDRNNYNRGNEQRNGDRGRKIKTFNYDEDETNDRATPLYTETTTFRTSTSSPIKEYQQLAESAAFATARGNRVNKVYGNNHFNYHSNEVSTAASTLQPSTTNKSRLANLQFSLASKKDIPAFPHSTFAPIYKPRTTTYEPTTPATSDGADRTNYNRWDRQEGSTTTEFDATSTTPYSTIPNFYYKTNNNPSSSFTDVVTETQEWISTTPYYSDMPGTVTSYPQEQASRERFTSPRFSNTELYNDNTLSNRDYSRTSYSTPRTFPNSQSTSKISGNLETSTESHGRNPDSVAVNFAISNATSDSNSLGTTRSFLKDNRAERNGRNRSSISRSSMRSWQNFRPNAISSSTDKPTRLNVSTGQQVLSNGKTPKPYDTSFTYKQGKIMSTLIPYIPFTKNYAYTTSTTTPKPPVYTATVPTYTTSNSQYRIQDLKTFNTIDNVTPTSINGLRRSSTYLPDVKSDISPSRQSNLDQRPAMERQHALNMLQSLRGLEGTVPTIIGNGYGNRSGLKIPHSSSPATLHSLALYFSTAGDTIKTFKNNNHDIHQNNTNVTEISFNSGKSSNQKNQTVELPVSVLTQHTINSYADLFNLNNALEVNGTTNPEELLTHNNEDESEEDVSDDLDLQQSEGPLDAARKSNNTKLRELAKIFTHALSAYLQDPDTFKKILTEIRPTDPSVDDDAATAVTASLPPTTIDDYPSVTKEKDEVLDFSDDVTPSKFKRPTTIIPPTSTETSSFSDDSGFGYYTTSIPSFETAFQTTTFTPVTENDQYSTQVNSLSSNFASQVNNAFDAFSTNKEYGETSGHTAPTFNEATVDYENYFPSGESAYNNEVGDVQQNNITAYKPYGEYVKPSDSVPINYDNYEQSSTPSSYEQTLPPVFHADSNKNAFNQLKQEFDKSTAPTVGKNSNVPATTEELFRIQYYDQASTTAQQEINNGESLATANSINPNYNNFNNGFNNNYGINNQVYTESTQKTLQPFTPSPSARNNESPESHTNSYERSESSLSQTVSSSNSVDDNSRLNNHWTSSPSVTQLWESTVFYDPKHINQGLTSQTADNPSNFDYFETVPSATTHSSKPSSQEVLVTDAANGITSRFGNYQNSPTSWQWSTTETDSPTMFTLLPSSHSTDQTATPTPIYTTRSSITTTITSSITSTSSLPSDSDIKTSRGDANSNNYKNNGGSERENEIIRAKEMFGKLNATSTDTLMKVMKHADENATVRKLVLLLINHCNGPMNKTKEQERELLLNALLRTSVNEFTSEESRELVAGISKLNLPIGNGDDLEAKSSSHYITSPKPAITTYRNKNSRRDKVNDKTSSTNNRGANSNNRIKSVNETDSTASDERALELLRSLYSVAAKWG